MYSFFFNITIAYLFLLPKYVDNKYYHRVLNYIHTKKTKM